jgi:uncharacterized protein (DUF779 family)
MTCAAPARNQAHQIMMHQGGHCDGTTSLAKSRQAYIRQNMANGFKCDFAELTI